MVERRQTALGVARARFIEGLPRKARELRASVALLAGTPDEARPREELRRRLHALYASAQVFRIEPLATALKEALARIDAVSEVKAGFSQVDLDELANLAATLPALAADANDRRVPSVAGLEVPDELKEPRPTQPRPGPKAPPPPPRSSQPEIEPSPRVSTPPRAHRHSGVQTVASVVVLGSTEAEARVRAALPAERFEVLAATDSDEALRIARAASPDLVLAERDLLLEGDVIARLREDPLTDFVPVVMLLPPATPADPVAVREAGADEVLSQPLDAAALLETVERLTGAGTGASASTLTGDLTVAEIAERIADEVKRGLVDSTEQGGDVAVPLGSGTPLMAAAWSAIGKVRAHLAERSGGRVRFREGSARGGPAFVSLFDDEDDSEALDVDSIGLEGRRVLVVDDDPAVVWFFAGLLREHGADVDETMDGLEALGQARRRRPDLVISDILMPGLDGFGLTRQMARDPALADVPVILISWKEDLLQRMRQLRAGASGYLRKEAPSGQILARVREVLRPRFRLEARLRAGGDIRGRVDPIGLQTLLITVGRLRPDARVTLRDAAHLFELDLREGALFDVTRTSSDGAFARGPRVLASLLGVTAGRFTVVDADAPVRRSIEGDLESVLSREALELAARIDAVSGRALARAARVELEEDLVEVALAGAPEPIARVVRALREGKGPRELLLEGAEAPQLLDEALVHLAREGAIRGVLGVNGEDRVALARAARARGELEPGSEAQEEEEDLSWLAVQETTGEMLLPAGAPKRRSSVPPAETLSGLDEPFEEEGDDGFAPDEGDDGLAPDEDEPILEITQADGFGDDEQDDDEDEDERPASQPIPADRLPASEGRASSAPRAPTIEPAPAAASSPPIATTSPPTASTGSGLWRWLGWAVALVALAFAGFIWVRALEAPPPEVSRPGPVPPSDAPEVAPEPEPSEPGPETEAVEVEPEAQIAAAPAAWGREERGVSDGSVEVGPGQGLLVLEPSAGGQVRVEVADAAGGGPRELELGSRPLAIALDAGVHHLTYVQGDHRGFIFVAVREQHTRYAPPPPPL